MENRTGGRSAPTTVNSLPRVEAKKKKKALAEHLARHPEDVGRTVEDFNWILQVIVRPAA